MLSKKASCNSHGQDSSYFIGWQEYERNPYHPTQNPLGVIQMGLAENQLSFDLLESWIDRNPDATAFESNGVSMFRELALFQDYHGLPAFKNALTEFMGELNGNRVKFDPDNLVLTAGATSANETLMFCLADSGDAFLVPTPYYAGFDRDLKWRTGVEIVPIQCSSYNKFQITKSALDNAYKQAEKLNLNVKGVLITNPSNPLGTSMSRTEIETLLNFIASKDIHLVSDEIYAGSTFDSPSFISVMEVMKGRKNIYEQVHIVYSLSKDLGLPGFRLGAIYSNNFLVVSAATKMSSFGLISSQTQYLLSSILSDKDFTKKYLYENKRRLKCRHQKFVKGLKKANITCLESNASLFCWVNMKHLLDADTFEAELKLWKKLVYEVGLNVSPGSSFHCSEPGWFRMCFANMSDATLDVAMERLSIFVEVEGNRKQMHMSRRLRSQSMPLTKWIHKLSMIDQTFELAR